MIVIRTAIFLSTALVSCGGATVEAYATPDDAGVLCGKGTVARGEQCVALDSGAQSEPSFNSCGPGTVAVDGICVLGPPDAGAPRYELRTLVTTAHGDGFWKYPLVALATDENGQPTTTPVVFGLTRSSAGTIMPTESVLSSYGTTINFVPCRVENSGCLGPTRITMALASDPSQIVAISPPIEVVVPHGVGTPAPCLEGGSTVFFDSDPIALTVKRTDGKFTFDDTGDSTFRLRYNGTNGEFWDIWLSTPGDDIPLKVGVYEKAQMAMGGRNGHPAMDISGPGDGCEAVEGRFEIFDLQRGALNQYTAVTATFERRCKTTNGPVLRGCLRVEN